MFETTLLAVLDSGHQARFVAHGDSMYPAIRDGEAVTVERCAIDSLRIGDVVLAHARRGLTAHRVIRIRRQGEALQITTRGDNCFRSDPPFGAAELIGRVTSVTESIKGGKRLFHACLTLFRLSRRIFSNWKTYWKITSPVTRLGK
jgi:signal peptidase I